MKIKTSQYMGHHPKRKAH